MKRLALTLVVLLLLPCDCLALFGLGDVVIDPSNLIQNSLQAIRSLQSNVHEVTMINQTVQSLANQARDLIALPMTLVEEVQRTASAYSAILNQGKAIAFQVQGAMSAFDQLFSGGGMPFLQRSQAILDQIRQSGRIATEIESIYTRLCDTAGQMERLTRASAAARGNLEVQQVANEMLGVMVSQQSGMYELQAATSRLHTIVTMQDMVSNEQARLNAQQWMAGYPLQPATWQRGRGIELPR